MENKSKNVHTLIIGAGISGLFYAINSKLDYLIVEKEETPGGLCRTFYQDGFVWDYAGHFFHFATPDLREYFEKRVHQDDMVKCVKSTNIYYNGVFVDYPFQMNIHELPKDEFIDCLYDLFNREEKDKYDNFEEMLYGKFGRSITDKFLKPYNEKLYACNLNDLDTDAMGRFFPYANPKQIIDNMKKKNTDSYNSTFDYPKRGAQFFVDILLNNIEKDRLMLKSEVESIDIDKKIAIVKGEKIHYEVLINTIPLSYFVKIIDNNFAEGMDRCLSCNKVLVFNLGFDRPGDDKTTHWTYFPIKDINFYRVGYYSNILCSEKLSMYVEIGFKEDDEINVKEQLTLTIENLRKLGIIKDHILESYNSIVIDPGYVHITGDSVREVDRIKDTLKEHDVYTTGRYGEWTYCSIEDCMIKAEKLAEINNVRYQV